MGPCKMLPFRRSCSRSKKERGKKRKGPRETTKSEGALEGWRERKRELSFQSQGQFSSRGRTEKANFTMEVIPGRGEKIVLSKEEVTWIHFFAKCVGMGRKEKQIDLSVDALTKTRQEIQMFLLPSKWHASQQWTEQNLYFPLLKNESVWNCFLSEI